MCQCFEIMLIVIFFILSLETTNVIVKFIESTIRKIAVATQARAIRVTTTTNNTTQAGIDFLEQLVKKWLLPAFHLTIVKLVILAGTKALCLTFLIKKPSRGTAVFQNPMMAKNLRSAVQIGTQLQSMYETVVGSQFGIYRKQEGATPGTVAMER